jgi:hypothetical protein
MAGQVVTIGFYEINGAVRKRHCDYGRKGAQNRPVSRIHRRFPGQRLHGRLSGDLV